MVAPFAAMAAYGEWNLPSSGWRVSALRVTSGVFVGPRQISTRPGARARACRFILSKSLPLSRAWAKATALGTGKKELGSRLLRSYGVLMRKSTATARLLLASFDSQ